MDVVSLWSPSRRLVELINYTPATVLMGILSHVFESDVNRDGSICVWLPLIQRALLIRGINGEGQMPRQNRLEVIPPPGLLMHTQAKQRLRSCYGYRWSRGYKAGIGHILSRDILQNTSQAITHHHIKTCLCMPMRPIWPNLVL